MYNLSYYGAQVCNPRLHHVSPMGLTIISRMIYEIYHHCLKGPMSNALSMLRIFIPKVGVPISHGSSHSLI